MAAERPDALLVSGDVFDTGTPGNDIAKKFNDELLDIADACPGMETVVIAGNHDSYSRLVVDESLWKRVFKAKWIGGLIHATRRPVVGVAIPTCPCAAHLSQTRPREQTARGRTEIIPTKWDGYGTISTVKNIMTCLLALGAAIYSSAAILPRIFAFI